MENLNYLNEEWRPINGYENLYEVSNYGRVKSLDRTKTKQRKTGTYTCLLKGIILKPYKINSGYYHVQLYNEEFGKYYLIHRLVARAFQDICGEWFDGCVIDHINGVKTDNRAINIKITTQFRNVNNNPITFKRMRKSREKVRKKVLQYTKDGMFVKEYDYLRQIEEELGYYHHFISDCCKGRYKTAYGYIWKFKEGA